MDRLYYQTLVVPAGTAITAPASQAWPLEDNELANIHVTVPDGHCGLTGFRILQAQQQIVPFANSQYLVANDEKIDYPFDDEITSTGLVLEGYNTDIFQHTFYVRALVKNLPLPGENPPAEVVTSSDQTSPIGLTTDDLDVDSILDTSIPEPAPVAPVTPVTVPPAVPVTTKPPVKKPGPIKRGLGTNKPKAGNKK
jgi:hypothetical protein